MRYRIARLVLRIDRRWARGPVAWAEGVVRRHFQRDRG